ncbi:NnrU family protein [Altererythrobacter sp.]|uniref:NnrU family protein n=1 Tax=Altererythrobacter sp. TaxID=1872480 RepID=UPI003D0B6DE8
MNSALIQLVAANVTFVGTHFAMSHPLRASLVKALGERGFQAVYSLVSLAAFAWVALAFRAAPPADLPSNGEAGWIIATLLMIPALVLFAGSFAGNPALPAPGADKLARQDPRGVFTVTRHPMMWAFGLWALAHIILFWSTRTLITASAMGFLALIGAHLQDRKKEALMGEAWADWEAKTSYWPRFGRLFAVGWLWWAIGIALWLLLSWLHRIVAGIDAGVMLWLG